MQLLKRVEVKRQEHWLVGTPEQMMNEKPWDNDVLQDLEEVLPLKRTEDF